MRHDPTYLVWTITCASPAQAEQVNELFRREGNLDAVRTVRVTAYPDGVEATRLDRHRLGDYFAEVRLIPDATDSSRSFRLLFHRSPTAGRYWKDLMVHLLKSLSEIGKDVSITLAYRGDVPPLESNS